MKTMAEPGSAPSLEDLLPYREEIFLLCLGFSRNAAVAEDLCQDVFLKACGKLDSVRSPGAAKVWLFRLARNICRDHYRRSRKVGFDPLDDRADLVAASNGGEPDDFEDRLVCLKSSVEALPRKLREVFILRLYARLSYVDVARTLRIKEGTVMSRLHRARAAVARSMNEVRHG
jgi:RNA polymerase sigma-70 factor (ECF subfamily)